MDYSKIARCSKSPLTVILSTIILGLNLELVAVALEISRSVTKKGDDLISTGKGPKAKDDAINQKVKTKKVKTNRIIINLTISKRWPIPVNLHFLLSL